MLKWCVLVGLDWAKPMISLLLHVTCSCIFHAYIPFFFILLILNVLVLFCLSLSLSFFQLVALWHLNRNLLYPETLFIPRHFLLHPLRILPPPMSDSMMIKPVRTFRRTFHNVAFIWNAKSFYPTFLILTFLLSSIVGVGSHCVASQSLVFTWSYRSFTSTYMDSTIMYLILSLTFEVHAL